MKGDLCWELNARVATCMCEDGPDKRGSNVHGQCNSDVDAVNTPWHTQVVKAKAEQDRRQSDEKVALSNRGSELNDGDSGQ